MKEKGPDGGGALVVIDARGASPSHGIPEPEVFLRVAFFITVLCYIILQLLEASHPVAGEKKKKKKKKGPHVSVECKKGGDAVVTKARGASPSHGVLEGAAAVTEGDAPPSPPPPHKGYPEDTRNHAAQAVVATGAGGAPSPPPPPAL